MTDELITMGGDTKQLGLWTPTIGITTQRLRKILLPDDDLSAADKIISESQNILSQCIPPTSDNANRIGLVCGYVQSGKTGSMTALSALAKDNGFRIVILLAGVTTNLVSQNRDRFESSLRNASSDWAWMMLNNPKIKNNREDIKAIVDEWRTDHYEEEDRRTLLISVMKNASHLRNLTELLSTVDLSNVPTIIFDDEADQASLNTRPNSGGVSTTYETIANLRGCLPHHTYLQYTATPQAPLLITRIDQLSADFAELVSPGNDYTGGKTFFTGKMEHVENIPLTEIFDDNNLPIDPPESLLKALRIFFIGVAVGRLQKLSNHRSMLVHPSMATASHKQYHDWTNLVKSSWYQLLIGTSADDRKGVISEFEEAYLDVCKTCAEIPAFTDIVDKLVAAINQTSVTLVNSKDGHEVPWQNGYSHILVGGEKLGRGYTVKGITVTYMPRSPGGWTADTIQQRARFFGYHTNYLGYCRIFLHPQVRQAYVAYVTHEEDMRDRLGEHRGRPLKDWRRMFYLDSQLAPTRRNVLSDPYTRPKLQKGWYWPKSPHISIGQGKHNRELISSILSANFEPDEEYEQHTYALLFLKDVYERVLVPLSYQDDTDALGLCLINCNAKTLIEDDPDTKCVVYLMSGGEERVRSLTGDRIPTLFQGRSSKGSESYPGDSAMSNETIPTIQIHNLTLKNADKSVTFFQNVPTLAIKMPNALDLLIHDEN